MFGPGLLGHFHCERDKADVFKEGIGFIFFSRRYEVDDVVSLSLSFLHHHLLDVIFV